MIRPLTGGQRRAAARCSLALCSVSLALLPVAMPPLSAAETAPGLEAQPPALPALPPALTYPSVAVDHNPFTRNVAPIAADDDALPPGFVLPPNAGILAPPRVRGLVAGGTPKALVEVDGHAAIVGIGTKLQGVAIVAIDARGILLENGERLTLEGSRP